MDGPAQMLVTTLEYANYVGKIAIGRLRSGRMRSGPADRSRSTPKGRSSRAR